MELQIAVQRFWNASRELHQHRVFVVRHLDSSGVLQSEVNRLNLLGSKESTESQEGASQLAFAAAIGLLHARRESARTTRRDCSRTWKRQAT
jgi:hypothetical protein